MKDLAYVSYRMEILYEIREIQAIIEAVLFAAGDPVEIGASRRYC